MTDQPIEIQDFILSRELAEVYLLLDHISAAEGKKLPDLGEEPIFASDSAKPWLVQICDIAWPPENTTREQDAANAAKLLVAKDALNEAASPATGTTIAFTLMMAGEAREPDKEASWWRRPRFGFGGGGGDGGAGGAWGDGVAGGPPTIPTRASLAALADHGLARWALFYRSLLYLLFIFLFLWAMFTCFLSWDIATGTALLNRVTSFDKRAEQAVVTTAPATNVVPSTGATASPGSPPSPSTSPTPAPSPSAAPTPLASGMTESDRKLHKTASENLAAWLESRGFMRWMLKKLMGASQEETTTWVEGTSPPTPASATAAAVSAKPDPVRTTNVQWATAFLGVLASNVLPIFYGLLGAGAAVVRGVSTKMRDSILSPRDIILAYVQLGLGAVMGLCIGLFVNPNTSPGGAAQPGALIGSIPLSASALCFIAGFGVEQVFRALESLIRRIFEPEPPRVPVKP